MSLLWLLDVQSNGKYPYCPVRSRPCNYTEGRLKWQGRCNHAFISILIVIAGLRPTRNPGTTLPSSSFLGRRHPPPTHPPPVFSLMKHLLVSTLENHAPRAVVCLLWRSLSVPWLLFFSPIFISRRDLGHGFPRHSTPLFDHHSAPPSLSSSLHKVPSRALSSLLFFV